MKTTTPSFIVSGTSSGSGKTTVALGLMAAFSEKGYTVQPFKCGPDFIDPGLHRLVTGAVSRNLDPWMCGESARAQSPGDWSDGDPKQNTHGVAERERQCAHDALHHR